MIESAARRLAHELVNRREAINRELSRNGVRFGIYKNGEYHDRLFPYDPVPRIIESDEYDELEKGLKQRVNALNAYLKDIYSDKAIIHDGVVPEEYVYTSAGYFPQVNGVTPPGGIFAHIAGEDLVQGEDGRWWVLEDNHSILSSKIVIAFPNDGGSAPDIRCAPVRFLFYLLFFFSRASRRASANWSGHEVCLKPQRMPSNLSITSSASIPSTIEDIPARLPLQPPVNWTL